jgi:hypothetical protein
MNGVFLLAALSLSCTGNEAPEVPATIETVSQEITFDSVARLGHHHAVADITRIEIRDGDTPIETTESIDLAWNSWTSFHFQRLVDGTPTFEVIAHEGQASSRDGRGPWRPDFDGEMARMDVYTKWNAWEEALGSFRERITFEDMGDTVVDGRPARRFKLGLAELPKKERHRNRDRQLMPHRIEGEVMLDKATAVRLRASIEATEKKVGLIRRTTLSIRRTAIGEIQSISKPQLTVSKPGAELRRMPKRPQAQ